MTAVGRVLVTGAAGRLGRAVCALLVDEGVDLLGTDVADVADVGHAFVQADLREHTEALRVLEGVDAVVHLGNRPGIGATPPQVVFNENVAINENVFQGAAERGVGRIVFASTLQLLGSWVDDRTVVSPPPPPRYPLDGDTTPTPTNVYSLSKTVSEVMLRYYAERCGIDAVALRFPLLHHGDGRRLVATGDESAVDVLEGFTGLRYDDAAAAVLAVLRTTLPGYRAYAPATSHRHRDLPVPALIERFYPDLPPSLPDLVDSSALTRDTGWRPAHDHHAHLPPDGRPTP